jgi:hypothetical protein
MVWTGFIFNQLASYTDGADNVALGFRRFVARPSLADAPG